MRSFIQELMHIHEIVTGSFCASRRDFLKAIAVLPFAVNAGAHVMELSLGILHDGNADDILRGARMSVGEAERAAALLRAGIRAVEYGPGSESPHVSAIVAALSSPARLEGITVPVINTAIAPSAPNVWHIGNAEWDPEGSRFGAAQLNARYRSAYDAPMTAEAWAGWFAVKVLWESALRARDATPQAIQEYLQSSRAAFDGHLGRPLRFDQKTRTLL